MSENGRLQARFEVEKDHPAAGKPAITITLMVDGDGAAEVVERILQTVREFLDERE